MRENFVCLSRTICHSTRFDRPATFIVGLYVHGTGFVLCLHIIILKITLFCPIFTGSDFYKSWLYEKDPRTHPGKSEPIWLTTLLTSVPPLNSERLPKGSILSPEWTQNRQPCGVLDPFPRCRDREGMPGTGFNMDV